MSVLEYLVPWKVQDHSKRLFLKLVSLLVIKFLQLLSLKMPVNTLKMVKFMLLLCIMLLTPWSPTFPKSIVLDDLPQVKDIEDITKTCCVGKMLGESIDIRTIIARTKEYWKFCKGDVEYLCRHIIVSSHIPQY